jgi:hypothetical protein
MDDEIFEEDYKRKREELTQEKRRLFEKIRESEDQVNQWFNKADFTLNSAKQQKIDLRMVHMKQKIYYLH